MVGFRLVAIKLGDGLKYEVSLNEIDRMARAIFDFEVSEHPLGSITSSRAQSIYDWVMTLAKQPMNEGKKLLLLQDFIHALAPEDSPMRDILKEIPSVSKQGKSGMNTDKKATNANDNTCFVIMPFEEPFNGYYQSILVPAISDAGLKPRRADEIFSVRPVIRDIWESIKCATLIIADLTGRNSNVLYELGLCHGREKSAIIITQSIEDVPFDLKHRRCIIYDTREPEWAAKLRKSITETVRAFLKSINSS